MQTEFHFSSFQLGNHLALRGRLAADDETFQVSIKQFTLAYIGNFFVLLLLY